jgi:hypothetical protein
VPEGWETFALGPAGTTVAHPPDWQVVQVSDTVTDFRAPQGGTYLRVDWTDQPPPSPVAGWEVVSDAFTRTKQNYREIRIEPVVYRGFDAAVWEYTYTEGGADLHAVNIGIATGPYGYALNFQTREGVWEESQDIFRTLQATFNPVVP